MNYKITLRRRHPDGSLETATYRLEHVHSSGGDDSQALLLAHMEVQANSQPSLVDNIPPVRVWVEEVA